ncbi:MAG: hypothetical protein HYZ57_16555 [Acidobacteria bacterium]|nr:hypothetical protein [Acidobacteriota bacterium]MBI3281443.1 hypothetical protein [Acidobacteriota bacterium]
MLTSPKTAIPVVLIRARDGATIIDHLKQSSGTATASLHPTNIQGFVSGTYQVSPDGKLTGVNLLLQLTTPFDMQFVGTITRSR